MRRLPLKQSVLLFATVAVMFSAGCKKDEVRSDDAAATNIQPTGYTCCNFHYSGDWINDGNYAQLPTIPAGTQIRLKGINRYVAHVDIDGKKFRLGLDYGRSLETTEQWVNKMIVHDDPKARLATYSHAVRKAIQSGQLMVGMSKEQVIMSIGYPMTSENPRPDAPFWRYWWSSFREYKVHWNGAGRVKEITGHPETVALMLAPGHATPEAAPASIPQAAKSIATKPVSTGKGVKNDAQSK